MEKKKNTRGHEEIELLLRFCSLLRYTHTHTNSAHNYYYDAWFVSGKLKKISKGPLAFFVLSSVCDRMGAENIGVNVMNTVCGYVVYIVAFCCFRGNEGSKRLLIISSCLVIYISLEKVLDSETNGASKWG